MTPVESLETYAATLVLVRHSLAQAAAGVAPDFGPLDSAARRIADSATVLLPLMTLAASRDDDAARAVLTAVVAAASARAAGADEAARTAIAHAALHMDVGRASLAGASNIDLSVFQDLPDALEALVPAANAAMAFASPKSDGARLATLTYEATWLERVERLGELYEGAPMPLIAGRLLALAHAFVERVAPRSGRDRRSPADAMYELLGLVDADAALLAAMVRALGPIPVGSPVELEDGSWAVVSAPAPWQRALRPEVLVLTSPEGQALQSPEARDLGADPGGPKVRRRLSPAEARFNPARAFFGVISDSSER
jgi:hypothetical protein